MDVVSSEPLETKKRPNGIMIIAVLWTLTSIFRINWGLNEVFLDFGELPYLYEPSEPEWFRFGVPADIVLSFSVVAVSFLTVFVVYGLFTAKPWSYKSALSIPVLTSTMDIALTALYASAPAELDFAAYFSLYCVLAVTNLVWIVVTWVYLRKTDVKQYIIGSLPSPLPTTTLHAGTAKGDVIKAIVSQSRPLTWREIHDATGLDEKSLNHALNELFRTKEIYKADGKYNVSQKLLFPNRRTELVSWINQWKEVKKLDFSLEHEHFFLEGRHLDDFSKELISHAKSEVLIVNPFIQDCDLSNTLIDVKKQGINVQIITRPPRDRYPNKFKKKREYHSKLKMEGISLVYNEKVHAKLIVVDNAVAIISSMNFYPDSSAGASWEVGLISIDKKVVDSIVSSPFARLA